MADFTASFAPGSVVAIFGTGLAAGNVTATSLPLPASLGGVSVDVIDGSRILTAPLFFVSPGQVNAQLPFDITGQTVSVRVRNSGGASSEVTVPVTAAAPRLFTMNGRGGGDAIGLHPDYSLSNAASPVTPGEVVMLYLVGLGAVNPSLAAGRVANNGASAPLNTVKAAVRVTLGGQTADVLFAGLAPGFVGLYQINIRIPPGLSGTLPLRVVVGTSESQANVTLPCAMKWTAAASAAVGTGGGTLSAAGFRMEIPAGAAGSTLDLRAERLNDGQWDTDLYGPGTAYAVSGLPAQTSQPIHVAFDISGVVPAADSMRVIVRREGEEDSEEWLKVRVEGTRVIATLPPRASRTDAKTAFRQPAAGTSSSRLIFYLGTGLKTVTSRNGLFRVLYGFGEKKALKDANGKEVSSEEAEYIGEFLERAYYLLVKMGFKDTLDSLWNLEAGAEPIDVGLVMEVTSFVGMDYTSQYRNDVGRNIVSPWNGRASLWIPTLFAEKVTLTPRRWIATAVAARTLFNKVRETYSPAKAAKPGLWDWLDAALAEAFARFVSPDGVRDRISDAQFVKGLAPPKWDIGWGDYDYALSASLFFEHLVFEEKDLRLFRRIYTMKNLLGADQSPITVLQRMLIDVGAQWKKFTLEYAEGHLFDDLRSIDAALPAAPTGVDLWAVRSSRVAMLSATWSTQGEQVGLSAGVIQLRLPATAPASAKIRVSLTCSDPQLLVFVYLYTNDQTKPAQMGAASPTIEFARAASGQDLWILVTHTGAGSVGKETPGTLKVEVLDILALPRMQKGTLRVEAGVSGEFRCSTSKDGKCAPSFYFRSPYRADQSFPLKWTGARLEGAFKATPMSGTCEDLDYSLKAEFSEDGQTLKSALVSQTLSAASASATCTGGPKWKTSFTYELRDLPLMFTGMGSVGTEVGFLFSVNGSTAYKYLAALSYTEIDYNGTTINHEIRGVSGINFESTAVPPRLNFQVFATK